MSRHYNRVHDPYIHILHELQPPQYLYHHHNHHVLNNDPDTSTAPSYETIEGAGPVDPGLADPAPTTSHHHHVDAQKQMHTYVSDEIPVPHYNVVTGSGSDTAGSSVSSHNSRKRKTSSYSGSTYDDDASEDSRTFRQHSERKQNHSEIEKRRRDKMNTYITELSSMVPMCGAIARKLDKLTVLRMAVQHMRSVRGALFACPLTARPRPEFISEHELNSLILQAAQDCFLLVVGCDRGRLLYVSASVNRVLQYDQSDLVSHSLFDILHPKDVAKVKEQLSSSDLSPRERLIDAKTMLPVKADVTTGASRLCPGARRSFFCRIKCKQTLASEAAAVKEEGDTNCKLRKKQINEKKYCVVQFTGYLKSSGPVDVDDTGEAGEGVDDETMNLSCLVAVGRALPNLAPTVPNSPLARNLHYVSRHATDGKFIFVDQRITLALGYLPQELLGTSIYEYVNGAELGAVARTHKAALIRRVALYTPPYNFRRKDGTSVRIQTHFKPFRNPWTKDIECLVANNTVMYGDREMNTTDQTQNLFDMFAIESDVEMQRLIDSQMESHKIGSAIAEDALRRNTPNSSPDIMQVVVNKQQASVVTCLNPETQSYVHVRNNIPLSSVSATSPAMNAVEVSIPPEASPPLPSLGTDGNGEAAMAVIMSLLETDVGYGGPMDVSGLPWLLP